MIEYRYMRRQPPEAGDDNHLSGRAWPYGSETMIGKKPWGFRETIKLGAGRKSVNDGDIVLLDNHEARLPLARMSAGTLEMRDGANGGDWDARVVDTSYGRDVVKNVKAKNYGGCSFGFEVIRDAWFDDDGNPADPATGTRREIQEMKVYEISVCTFPAYQATVVSARAQVDTARGVINERMKASELPDLQQQSPHDIDPKLKGDADEDEEAEEEDRAAVATYDDLSTCAECGTSAQYGKYCAGCGEPMSADRESGKFCTSCGSKLESGSRTCHNCGEEIRDSKKPYGDVTYADPGYQSDGKKRYPLDTSKHIHAAWSYINQAKNAAKYTAQQLASIKAKIKSAMKKIGATVSSDEKKLEEWAALADFREMTEGYDPESEDNMDFGVAPAGVVRSADVNDLAKKIVAAANSEERVACIELATNLDLAEMLPAHWGSDGEIGALATDEVLRDMDQIYTLALSLNPTRTTLNILDLAGAYLSKESREAKEEPDEPSEPVQPLTMTLEEARKKLAEANDRRKAVDRAGR